MANSEVINSEKKPSLMWSLIKSFVLVLFPGIRLLKINQGLKRANSFYKHEWFKKQRLRNTLVSLGVSFPLIISSIFSFLVAYKAEKLWSYLGAAQTALFKFELGKFGDLLMHGLMAPDSLERFKVILHVSGAGLITSIILGTFVILTHPLIRDSKKLYGMLQRNGVIDKDEKGRLVIATPLGFLIDITGNTAKEIKDNERIWMALNLRVTDWAEDPHQRAICFFKKAYNLKTSYHYSFN